VSLSRRQWLATIAGCGAAVAGARVHAAALDAGAGLQTVRLEETGQALAAIEQRCGGRLGVQVLGVNGTPLFGQRTTERFPLCSTFKVLAAGLVLQRVDRGQERLDRVVPYVASELVTYSPETGKHVGAGMTIGALCDAALTLSDNTAANLLLASFGGPEAVTLFARSLGDDKTRLDRRETELNEALPGDERDTTTPALMARNLRTLLLGNALSAASRERLLQTMRRNRTGDHRLRAGLPPGTEVADKTGSGERGTANDIGLVQLPGRLPVFVTVYLTGATADAAGRDAAIADVARLVAAKVR
jgi:beta-lactamase class A